MNVESGRKRYPSITSKCETALETLMTKLCYIIPLSCYPEIIDTL